MWQNVFHYLCFSFMDMGKNFKPTMSPSTFSSKIFHSEAPASSALPGAGSTGCRGRHLGATCPGWRCPAGHTAHGERLLGASPSISRVQHGEEKIWSILIPKVCWQLVSNRFLGEIPWGSCCWSVPEHFPPFNWLLISSACGVLLWSAFTDFKIWLSDGQLVDWEIKKRFHCWQSSGSVWRNWLPQHFGSYHR